MLLLSRLTHCAAIKDNKSVKKNSNKQKKKKKQKKQKKKENKEKKKKKNRTIYAAGKPLLQTVFKVREHMEKSTC